MEPATSGTTPANGSSQAASVETKEPTAHAKATAVKVPKSCTKAFDSLYYCYSPMFQARQYYMNGQLDNCRGRLRRFRLCLLSRLKPQSQAEQLFIEDEHRAKVDASLEHVEPVWEMREEYLASVNRAEAEEGSDELLSPKEKSSWWL